MKTLIRKNSSNNHFSTTYFIILNNGFCVVLRSTLYKQNFAAGIKGFSRSTTMHFQTEIYVYKVKVHYNLICILSIFTLLLCLSITFNTFISVRVLIL